MKYKLNLLLSDGYCGVEVADEKENISTHLKVHKKPTLTSDEYSDKKYENGKILKKLGKWQRRNRQHGINCP